jgi:RNA polymerase sigma factor (sigma-70 family)
MSNVGDEILALLRQAEGGDEEAARELVRRFEPHVRRVVRQRLPDALRARFDSMDFVQSVWGDVFRKLRQGTVSFSSREQFARFLAVVARGKVVDEVRRNLASQKADMKRELPADALAQRSPEPFVGQDPTPSQVVSAHEQFELLVQHRSELHRKILALRAEGYTFIEIADRLKIDERTARRVVRAAQEEWQKRRQQG